MDSTTRAREIVDEHVKKCGLEVPDGCGLVEDIAAALADEARTAHNDADNQRQGLELHVDSLTESLAAQAAQTRALREALTGAIRLLEGYHERSPVMKTLDKTWPQVATWRAALTGAPREEP